MTFGPPKRFCRILISRLICTRAALRQRPIALGGHLCVLGSGDLILPLHGDVWLRGKGALSRRDVRAQHGAVGDLPTQ